MIPSLKTDGPASACCFTHSRLPEHVNGSSLPKKRPPFSIALAHPCIHTLDLLLPSEVWQLVEQHVDQIAAPLQYSKVCMSLLDVVSGEFFSRYIKTGDIVMISEGRPHVDNRFSLQAGILKLELDKPLYERCGLVGKPIPGLGRKHIKSRYVVEINLRLPSMVRGRKAFDRIVYAFTHALNHSLTWLFVDLQPTSNDGTLPPPIALHHPQTLEIKPSVRRVANVVVPIVRSRDGISDPTYQEQLLEWLALAFIDSPRICAADDVDPYLCRYQLPESVGDGFQHAEPQDLVHVRWQGLLTSSFVTELLLCSRRGGSKEWMALAANDFEGTAYTVMCLDEREVLSWECS